MLANGITAFHHQHRLQICNLVIAFLSMVATVSYLISHIYNPNFLILILTSEFFSFLKIFEFQNIFVQKLSLAFASSLLWELVCFGHTQTHQAPLSQEMSRIRCRGNYLIIIIAPEQICNAHCSLTATQRNYNWHCIIYQHPVAITVFHYI